MKVKAQSGLDLGPRWILWSVSRSGRSILRDMSPHIHWKPAVCC